MKRKLRIVLEPTVEDLSDEDRAELKEFMHTVAPGVDLELGSLSETTAAEIAKAFEGVGADGYTEITTGAELDVKVSMTKVESADWVSGLYD
ncbi:hypothetical protein [Hyphomicrobium sp.]|uniref:hypothetical protein n=1 Tax=Hyphomicrobium sp. TaxID=82 RepID=UPI001D677094|nr:hypothetical protein [Hyphomicrobium sp.]MBY0560147.1 hypothetical protein [Hyphomicrobium sp.]